MTLRKYRLVWGAVGVLLASVMGGAVAHAASTLPLVSDSWARASAGMARAGAAFMTIVNPSDHDLVLVAAKAKVSDTVELHTHINDNGVMRMRRVDEIIVPARGQAKLKPGGLHVMFIGLNGPLAEGTSFDVTLEFASGETIVVPVTVRRAGAR